MKARRALVKPRILLSMRKQCELLGVSRSSLYYQPVGQDPEELAMMRRMDETHLAHPFFGSRMMTQTLRAEGETINRKRVQRLMRLMGLESVAPKPKTSKPAPEHAVFPYLLRRLKISRVNQVWASQQWDRNLRDRGLAVPAHRGVELVLAFVVDGDIAGDETLGCGWAASHVDVHW